MINSFKKINTYYKILNEKLYIWKIEFFFMLLNKKNMLRSQIFKKKYFNKF